MIPRIIPLEQIAALDECLNAVDMRGVTHYRGKEHEPIKLHPKGKTGYYFVEDGHHRIMAAMLEGCTHIKAEVDGKPVEISWRHPRIAPVLMTGLLLKKCGVK
jgi:hypothetical protein